MSESLSGAKVVCHGACQWVTKAARANLEPKPDDSHSNLGWDVGNGALVSHPLGRELRLGFRFSDPALLILLEGSVVNLLELAGQTDATVESWVNQRLIEHDLNPVDDVAMPYLLDEAADYSDIPELTDDITSLGGWFAQAHGGLNSLAKRLDDATPGPSPVRCWPHHFDIATLIGLAEGDPETAPSIGVGLSPGDSSYQEPYFYCSPWPVPDHLPPAPSPWRWHTDGFTSLICTAATLDHETDDLSSILDGAVNTVRELLDKS